MKILLVEDDRDTAAYIGRSLKEHGHVVNQAETGRDGLFMATGEPYDVLVIDRMLTGMDGLALLREIKRLRPDVPVMMVTAYGDDERRRSAAEAGAAQFLTKPVDFDRLKAELRQLPGVAG